MDGGIYELRVRAETDAMPLSDSVRFDAVLDMSGYPAMGIIVYDRSGSFDSIKAGQTAVLEGRVRSAAIRYGQRYDSYRAKGIQLIVNVDEAGLLYGEAERPLIQRLKSFLIGRIDSVFEGRRAVFMRALMTGDKDRFYDDLGLYTDMSRAGLMHIVAVSGMHISILMSFLCFIFGRTRPGRIVCLALIWVFVLMTGSTPSAVRAGIMNSFLMLAGLFGRENDVLSSLSIALALILLCNPYAATSISLQLSFAAVLGIVLVNDRFSRMDVYKRSKHSGALNYIVDTAVCSAGVMLFTAPLTAIHFGSVNLLSPLANILALWAVTYCFCLGYVACMLPGFLLFLAKLTAFAAGLLADFICLAARLISEIPFCTVYTSAPYFIPWLSLSYALVLALVFVKKRRLRYYAAAALASCLLLAVGMLSVKLYYRAAPTFGVIDVGQGQSVVLMSGGKTVMVDCGNTLSLDDAGDISGQYLLSRGRKSLDILVLTHLHTDHADGVPQLLEYVRVKTLILPEPGPDDAELHDRILSAAMQHGTDVRYVYEDGLVELEDIELRLYAPREAGGSNERCVCVRLSAGDYDCMISADSPMSRERELVRNYELSETELLIVGHHGSKYSSCPEYLSALGGETAVISCGYNSYGHPTQEVLERLMDYGYNILRTDMDSTVEIRVVQRGSNTRRISSALPGAFGLVVLDLRK